MLSELKRIADSTNLSTHQVFAHVENEEESSGESSLNAVTEDKYTHDYYFMSMDIGVTNGRLGIFDLDGNLTDFETFSMNSIETADDLEKQVEETIESLGLYKEDMARTTVAIAGIINKDGTIDAANHSIETLENFLVDVENLYVRLMNDSDAQAFGEYIYGCGSDVDNFVYFNAGTGISAGIVTDGELYSGQDGGNAGEIGFTTVDYDGMEETHGRNGVLEASGSGANIVPFVKQKLEDERRNTDLDRIETPEEFFEVVESGDPVAQDYFDDLAERYAHSISDIINSLNPDRIGYGGSILRENPDFVDEIRSQLEGRPVNPYEIVKGDYGYSAGVLGAGWDAVQSVADEQDDGPYSRFLVRKSNPDTDHRNI